MSVQPIHNERALLLGIAAGNEEHLKILFEAYRDRLFIFINDFVHSEEVAEELVLDIFLKLWLGKELLPRIEDLRAFLYRVARNKTIDFFRANSKNTKLKEGLMQRLSLQDASQADEVLMIKEYEQLLREAIAQLSNQRRQAYLLSRDQNLSHEEIAQEMNISKNTVNSHISEAQRFIRQYLAKNLDLALVLVLFQTR